MMIIMIIKIITPTHIKVVFISFYYKTKIDLFIFKHSKKYTNEMADNDIDFDVVERLFTIKKNQLKVVEKRGYNIDKERGILTLTLPQFLNIYLPFAKQQGKSFRGVLTFVYSNNEGKQLLVYYADMSKTGSQLGVAEVSEATSFMDKNGIREAMIITPKQLSTPAAKNLAGLVAYNIDVFLEEQLGYYVFDHFLVPEHIPLSEQEERDFLSKNQISIDQMPVILSSDIVIKLLGIRAGKIVKIVRHNLYETPIRKSIVYKLVKDE